MTDTPEAVRLADPIKPLADAPIVAWCIESTDSADWCWSATRDGVIDNAKFLDDGCAPGEPFAVIRQADHQAQMNALLRRIPELETARDVAVELAAQYAADRDQLRAELEKVRAPEGWRLVPAEPTEAMLDRAVAFALNVHLSSGYGWTQYMRDLWGRLLSGLAAAPTPPHADQKGQ